MCDGASQGAQYLMLPPPQLSSFFLSFFLSSSSPSLKDLGTHRMRAPQAPSLPSAKSPLPFFLKIFQSLLIPSLEFMASLTQSQTTFTPSIHHASGQLSREE